MPEKSERQIELPYFSSERFFVRTLFSYLISSQIAPVLLLVFGFIQLNFILSLSHVRMESFQNG